MAGSYKCSAIDFTLDDKKIRLFNLSKRIF